jgi:hypothetical protein
LNLTDLAGLVGVAVVLVAYGGAALGKIPASGLVPLVANLIGACLILLSMTHAFNLPAFAMEASWAVVAAIGLVRLAVKRRP